MSASVYFHPVSRVPNPGNTLYYWENAGGFAWAVEDESGCFHPDFWNFESAPVGGWHGGVYRFTASYVDGHAASIHMEGRIYPPPYVDLPAIPGYPDEPEIDRYFGLCSVIRGPGWQLDVLPAAPVPTNISPGDYGEGSRQTPVE
ncbi:MAG: hypothetical protein IID39_00500 [Planctomycetes bacterium]|nr:hypothetical protein [Planctomycetota bacterium]